MTIRPAIPTDVPAVLAMVQQLAALHESWVPAKYGYRSDAISMYASWLPTRASDLRSVFLVAERENRAVGFLVGTVEKELPIYRLKEFGLIHDVWVDPQYRNEGVARQMTMLAIERFKQIGVTQIRLDTAAPNDVAQLIRVVRVQTLDDGDVAGNSANSGPLTERVREKVDAWFAIRANPIRTTLSRANSSGPARAGGIYQQK